MHSEDRYFSFSITSYVGKVNNENVSIDLTNPHIFFEKNKSQQVKKRIFLLFNTKPAHMCLLLALLTKKRLPTSIDFERDEYIKPNLN